MAENTAIEWADHTFNGWVGCTKISKGCDGCYAEAWAKRAGKAAGVTWGGERRRTSEANWRKPLWWNRLAEVQVHNGGHRPRVFCSSLADVFDNQVPPKWREDLFELIRKTPHLDWLLLTKRIGNAAEMIKAAIANFDIGYVPAFAAWPWPNVWIGATVTDQAEADRDVPRLLAVPARVRFLSIEPMLGPIDLRPMFEHRADQHGDTGLHWVIVGGESGPGARPMHPDWARSLRDQCAAAGVPFLFKQWGEWCPRGPESLGYPSVDGVPRVRLTNRGENGQVLGAKGGDDVWMNRAGKKAAGRQLDGRTHDEFPS